MKLVVIAKDLVAEQTMRIRFAAADQSSLPGFAPGAHVELTFAGMMRRYSLTSDARNLAHYEICALRADPGRGGSAYLHDSLMVGGEIEVSPPVNAFPLNIGASHSVFIAGGIGITPFLTMMTALQGAERSFELHYVARSAGRFLRLSQYAWQTTHYTKKSGTSLDVGRMLTNLNGDTELYVCGPRSMIEAVRLNAMDKGWPQSRIHFESFGAPAKPGDGPVRLHLAQSRATIYVEPGTTILDALLAHGVWAGFECRRGECGSCTVDVISGDPDHRDVCLTSAQRQGAMCPCVSWSRSAELTLNL